MKPKDTPPARGFVRRPGYPLAFQPADRPVRIEFDGVTIVDSAHAMLMLEDGHAPVYYFERDEVRMDLLSRTNHSSH